MIFFFCLIEWETDTHHEDRDDDDERVMYWDLVEIDDKHLGTDECEDKCESYRQISESIDDTRECEVEWPQSHYRKDIRRIDDEFILSDSEDRRDTIHGEDEISGLDKYETHEEWSPVEFRFFSDKKFVSMEFFLEWDDFIRELDGEAFFWIDLHLTTGYELVCGIEEYTSEYIDNPVENLKQWYSREDEYHTEEYSTQHSPEEDLMLVSLRYREVCKYDGKYEDIIDWESFFDEISREELEGFLLAEPLIYKSVKYKCERYPYRRPCESLFHRDFLTLSMKDSEIECQHEEDKNIEPHPKPDIDFHGKE